MEDMKRKLQKMADEKKEKEWSNNGIRKQAEWAMQVRDDQEELRASLQAKLGDEFSGSLKELVKAGEKRVNDRIHLLRIADKFGWAGANDFVEEELARDEKEEKKLKSIRKEFEAKKEKKGQGSGKGKGNFLYKKQVENYEDTRKPDNQGAKNCFECDRPGHLARDCHNRRDDRTRGGRDQR